MHIAQQVSGKGFNDMKEGGMEEILTETALEPINKDLEETAKHGSGVSNDKDSDKSQPQTPKPLTAAKILEWNSALEKDFNNMEECDPNLENSLTLNT